MIYITYQNTMPYEPTFISNVWQIDCDDAEERWKEFMLEKANSIGLIINPHHLNAMSYEKFHSEEPYSEYAKKYKWWNKRLKENTFENYLENVLGAKKVEYKEIY